MKQRVTRIKKMAVRSEERRELYMLPRHGYHILCERADVAFFQSYRSCDADVIRTCHIYIFFISVLKVTFERSDTFSNFLTITSLAAENDVIVISLCFHLITVFSIPTAP